MLYVFKNWTSTSGAVYGFLNTVESQPASNSTARIINSRFLVRHQSAFNVTEITAAEFTAQSTAGFSSGTLGTLNGARFAATHSAGGAVTAANDILVTTPSITGLGVVGTWTQILLQDLSGGTVTTRIAIRQQGTNAHNRLQGGVSIGADAVMTAGFIADVTGDLRVSSGLNVGGTTTLANGEGIFVTSLAVGKTTAAANALDVTGKIACTSHVEIDGDLDHDGSQVGFYGVTPVARPAAYTITNDTSDRTLDADTVLVSDVADVLATVIRDLASQGLLQVA